MRILVTWGSRAGGTAEIGQAIAEELGQHGFEVVAQPASSVRSARGFDAAIIGGAIYAGIWHGAARRFIDRELDSLRGMPVWLFSSGPLDGSAETLQLPPTSQQHILAERLGAIGHVTFGGRLKPDAKGFPAAAMAKKHAGDWRNFDRVRAWAAELAERLPEAKPNPAQEPPARSVWRMLTFGLVGWVLCVSLMAALLTVLKINWALTLHAVGTPVIYYALARRYFGARGARDPLQVALVFTGMAIVLHAVVVAGVIERSPAMLYSPLGTWLPIALTFVVVYATGQVGLMVSNMPRTSVRPPEGVNA